MNSVTVSVVVLIAAAVLGGLFVLLRMKSNGDSNAKHIWFGLRVVDIFVPIARGTDVLVSGDEKAGARVLGTELMYRLMHHPQEKFHIVYYIDSTLRDLNDWKKELTETLPELTSYHVVDRISTDHLTQQIRSASHKQVAVFALSYQQSFLDSFRVATQQVRSELQNSKTITSFAISELNRIQAAVNIVVSRSLATAAIYPAIDINQSESILNSPTTNSRRTRTAAKIKLLISEVMKDLYQDAVNDPQWQYNTDTTLRPAIQALLFNSQPLFVATPFTGMPGAYIKESVAINDYERIAAGSLNALPNAKFRFRNEIQG